MVTRLDKLILGIELHICCLITREMIDKCNYDPTKQKRNGQNLKKLADSLKKCGKNLGMISVPETRLAGALTF